MMDLNNYSPKSKVLFIFICSGTKDDESERILKYDNKFSILNSGLSSVDKLKRKRGEAYEYIKKLSNSGSRLSLNPYNDELVFGKDLGGIKDGKYLPAISEYVGRFYNDNGLGSDGIKKLFSSGHHVLIISGLYGILYPNELIQLYECPLEDLPEFKDLWSRDEVISDIISEYVVSNNIQFLVDLTAQYEYRNLVNWSIIKNFTGIDVFHVHSKHFAGEEGLKFLGKFTRNRLFNMGYEEYSKINEIYISDSCCLSRSVIPPNGWPMEESGRIQKLLYSPESSLIEFKPALTGSISDMPLKLNYNEMKYRVMKNIVAMLNSNGGEIIIGVNDSREVKGLDREINGLYNHSIRCGENKEKDDLYFQIFDQMVVEYIGKIYLNHIKVHFWTYDNKTILIVNVSPSVNKASLKIDKKGKRLEEREYWIRGNSGDRKIPYEELKNINKQ